MPFGIHLIAVGLSLIFSTTPAAFGEEQAGSKKKRLRLHFKGMKIYESQCLPCHGKMGRGDGPWARDLTPKPRDFRSGIFKFRSTPYASLPTDDDLRRTIRTGITRTAMPSFTNLRDDEVDGLIVYLKSFSRRWSDKSQFAEPLTLSKVPAWMAEDPASETHVRAGKKLYQTHCASCHGNSGAGDGPAARGLEDVWGDPIRPEDLRSQRHRSGNADCDLYRSIATGLGGTPMPGFSPGLSEGEIWDLVAFIRSIEAAPDAEKPHGTPSR